MKKTKDLVLKKFLDTFFYSILDCYLSSTSWKKGPTLNLIFLLAAKKGVKTIGKHSSGQQNGGRGRLIEVAAK